MTTTRKKKKTMSIIFIILLIISGIGGKYLMDKQTEHERQVAFLKEHEAEMTEYIKSQNEKIETVEYDWDSVEIGTIGNGTPQGAGIALNIFGYVNQNKNIDFSLSVVLDQKNKENITNIYFGSGPDFKEGEKDG
jgi:ABC-type Fe3+-hydroxamate transport system substrate-binding protein